METSIEISITFHEHLSLSSPFVRFSVDCHRCVPVEKSLVVVEKISNEEIAEESHAFKQERRNSPVKNIKSNKRISSMQKISCDDFFFAFI